MDTPTVRTDQMNITVVTCGVRRMNLPAEAADGVYLHVSFATVWTTAVTGVMKLPVRTAPLVSSPVGRLTPACPDANCVTGGRTAKTGGMRLRRRVVWPGHAHRPPPCVQHLSFSVEMGSASARAGGVTTQQTALTAATRTTAIRTSVRLIMEAVPIGVWT